MPTFHFAGWGGAPTFNFNLAYQVKFDVKEDASTKTCQLRVMRTARETGEQKKRSREKFQILGHWQRVMDDQQAEDTIERDQYEMISKL